MKCYYDSRCMSRVTYSCRCTEPEGYFCDEHFNLHCRINRGTHPGESLVFQISRDEKIRLTQRLTYAKSWLHAYEANILYIARKLIEKIQKESAQTLKKIQELEIEFNRLITEEEANKTFYEMLLEIEFENDNYIASSAEKIRASISELFSFYDPKNFSSTDCNEAIFSGGPYSIQMGIRSLKTDAQLRPQANNYPGNMGYESCNIRLDNYSNNIILNTNSGLSILYKNYTDKGLFMQPGGAKSLQDFGDIPRMSNYNEQKCPITDSIVTGLVSIDLNTLQLSILDYAPEVGPFYQICKISKNTYLMQGCNYNQCVNVSISEMQNFRQPQSNCYLINVKEKTFKTITNGPNKVHAGSVLKNNKVYIFGGYNQHPLQTCESLSLNSVEWSSISPLPEISICTTAAILGNYIILSGYDLSCCYSYDDSAYVRILELNKNCLKVVCNGWILTESVLYENQQGNHLQWKGFNVLSSCKIVRYY